MCDVRLGANTKFIALKMSSFVPRGEFVGSITFLLLYQEGSYGDWSRLCKDKVFDFNEITPRSAEDVGRRRMGSIIDKDT